MPSCPNPICVFINSRFCTIAGYSIVGFSLIFSGCKATASTQNLIEATEESILGVPASPYPLTVQQPDGTSLQVVGQGDERISYAETIDGYTLLRNNQNIYEYATIGSNGKLEPSGKKANDPENRRAEELAFLQSIQKHLRNR